MSLFRLMQYISMIESAIQQSLSLPLRFQAFKNTKETSSLESYNKAVAMTCLCIQRHKQMQTPFFVRHEGTSVLFVKSKYMKRLIIIQNFCRQMCACNAYEIWYK
jgi:hypothetical protein